MTNKNNDSMQKHHEHLILAINFTASSNTFWGGGRQQSLPLMPWQPAVWLWEL